MTGKIRRGLGLVVAAVIALLLGLLMGGAAPDIAGYLYLAAVVLVLVGLVQVASDLLRRETSSDA